MSRSRCLSELLGTFKLHADSSWQQSARALRWSAAAEARASGLPSPGTAWSMAALHSAKHRMPGSACLTKSFRQCQDAASMTAMPWRRQTVMSFASRPSFSSSMHNLQRRSFSAYLPNPETLVYGLVAANVVRTTFKLPSSPKAMWLTTSEPGTLLAGCLGALADSSVATNHVPALYNVGVASACGVRVQAISMWCYAMTWAHLFSPSAPPALQVHSHFTHVWLFAPGWMAPPNQHVYPVLFWEQSRARAGHWAGAMQIFIV